MDAVGRGKETKAGTKGGKGWERKGRKEVVTITGDRIRPPPFPPPPPPRTRARARQQSANALMETSVIRVYSLCTSNYPFPTRGSRVVTFLSPYTHTHTRGTAVSPGVARPDETRRDERRGEERRGGTDRLCPPLAFSSTTRKGGE